MWSLAVSGYSSVQTDAALHSSLRKWLFRYDLLDVSMNLKKALTTISACSITNNTKNAVQRTATLDLLDDPAISFTADHIRPWARLQMPDGGFAEWPLGTFLLSSAPRGLAQSAVVRSGLQAYDRGQILQDDKFTDRYTVTAGTNVVTAVATILTGVGIVSAQQNLTTSTATLPATQDWPLGTSKAKVVKDLLDAINYTPLWFDAMGVAQASPYILPNLRPSSYTYKNDTLSLITPGIQDGLDLFAVPNVWVLAVSQSDRTALRSVYTNSNPNSLTSTVTRGRNIVSVDTSQKAVDQATLDAAAKRAANTGSQVYEVVNLPTALMPHHAFEDVITVVHSTLGVSASFLETGWVLQCRHGAVMQHNLERIVSV